jgi:hypothetical protein
VIQRADVFWRWRGALVIHAAGDAWKGVEVRGGRGEPVAGQKASPSVKDEAAHISSFEPSLRASPSVIQQRALG